MRRRGTTGRVAHRTECPNCGRALVNGKHRQGGLWLMTSITLWSRADVEDVLGMVVPDGVASVLVEQSALWATPLPGQGVTLALA